MRRAIRFTLLPTLFVGLFSVAVVSGTRQAGAAEVRVVPVSGAVKCLFGRGGNIALLGGADGVVMIDSQFSALAASIGAAVEELGHGGVQWLINTHWHGDHTGGNESFGAAATVVAHTNVRRRLEADPSIGGTIREGAPRSALPEITYDSESALHLNGETIQLWHIGPGHTDGDTVVWFSEAKACHMGDLYFQSSYPYIDLNSGGDIRGMLAAVDAVLQRLPADAKVIPGHGEISDRSDLIEYRDMLDQVIARVSEALGEGRSTEEILEARLLDDLNPRWGQGQFMSPARFLPIVIENLRAADSAGR